MAEIVVVVATTSAIKVAAVRKAFERIKGSQIKIESVKAASEIAEQPVGNTETITGAKNRLNNAKKTFNKKYDFVVSIENGIYSVQTDIGEMWYDVGWVLVEDANGKQSLAPSSAVQFPNVYVDSASKKGFKTTTVGSEIAKANTGVNELDPHSFLTKNATSREELLVQALLVAIGQL